MVLSPTIVGVSFLLCNTRCTFLFPSPESMRMAHRVLLRDQWGISPFDHFQKVNQ